MIRYFDPYTGEYRTMTSSEIKAEIITRLQLDTKEDDPTNRKYIKQTNQAYKRALNLYGNRVRNYTLSQGLTKSLSPQELLLRTLRRQMNGQALTAEQENILQMPTTSSTAFASTLQNNQQKYTYQAIAQAENIFAGFLRKLPQVRAEYNAWLNEEIPFTYVREATGEIVGGPGEGIILTTVKRKDVVSGQDVIDYLSAQAKGFHDYQDYLYQQNKAYYKYNRRNVGTP